MTLRQLRQTVLGADRDVAGERVLERVTVGVLAAWVAMGGDLLGSCVYGPDVLARAAGGQRSVLLVASVATLGTLAILAWAYTRMIARFPHGGGGYTAAKHVLGQRTALVSGVALVLDAAFNVAVSVVACVDAAADALPSGWDGAKLPAALALVGVLTILNLRGVKESVAVLVPILLAFVVSHVAVLGLAVADRAAALPGALAAVPADLHGVARERGLLGTAGTLLRAYALGGAIYTGLESVSNGLPILREPKVRSARRTMWLVAGIPGAVLAIILTAYLLYDVRPDPGRTMNALLFERVAVARGGGGWGRALVVGPLLAEALLLLMAAQTGFVDGPRILGALATDRFLPRRLARLNGRLAPAPGILVVAAIALGATALTGASLAALVAVFVVAVLVTFTISQWAMLRHALRLRGEASWRGDAALHGIALALCLVILAGSVAAGWRGAAVTGGMIAAAVALAVAIRRRYDAMARAVDRVREEVRPPTVPRERQAPVVPTDHLVAKDAPVAVLVLGERMDLARVALAWLSHAVAGVILAHVSLLDAEAVQGEERLRALEEERRSRLARVAEEVRRAGFPVAVELRRGADVLETYAALVRDLMRGRPAPSVVVGFRSTLDASPVDPLLRDDLAVRLQARLEREKIPMIVASIPLEA